MKLFIFQVGSFILLIWELFAPGYLVAQPYLFSLKRSSVCHNNASNPSFGGSLEIRFVPDSSDIKRHYYAFQVKPLHDFFKLQGRGKKQFPYRAINWTVFCNGVYKMLRNGHLYFTAADSSIHYCWKTVLKFPENKNLISAGQYQLPVIVNVYESDDQNGKNSRIVERRNLQIRFFYDSLPAASMKLNEKFNQPSLNFLTVADFQNGVSCICPDALSVNAFGPYQLMVCARSIDSSSTLPVSSVMVAAKLRIKNPDYSTSPICFSIEGRPLVIYKGQSNWESFQRFDLKYYTRPMDPVFVSQQAASFAFGIVYVLEPL